MTIMSLHEQRVKVKSISLTVYYGGLSILKYQTKQKHKTKEVIAPFLIWLEALSVKYESRKSTWAIIPH